jgi:hypothetical protein
MLRLLTALGTLLSLLAFVKTGSETRPPIDGTESDRWSVAVKTHNQFDNWT